MLINALFNVHLRSLEHLTEVYLSLMSSTGSTLILCGIFLQKWQQVLNNYNIRLNYLSVSKGLLSLLQMINSLLNILICDLLLKTDVYKTRKRYDKRFVLTLHFHGRFSIEL